MGTGYANYADALDPKYGEPYDVPIVMATKETLKGYGRIVEDFETAEVDITPWPVQGWRKLCPGTGKNAGIIKDDLLYTWDGDICKVVEEDINDVFVIGRLPSNVSPDNRTHVLVREANYHPDGGQIFFPKNNETFVALLALPTDDIKLENFVAFYFDGSFGVHIFADIWHQPVYPISDNAHIVGKQGSIFACVSVDTVNEFGKYLSVPLTKPE